MTCVRCRFFTFKDLPDGAVDGEGQCVGYLESLRELVAWNRPQCGLYRPAKPLAPRENWVEARVTRMGEAAHVVDPPAPPAGRLPYRK
jgi:hypothetical protein